MRVRILRQASPESSPYWQEFNYECSADQTVAGMLEEMNSLDDLKDAEGKKVPHIIWECSCLQGMCGACAMVINGQPALACETFIRNIKGDLITLEPLRKFPTIKDLAVDRSVIQEKLLQENAYIEEYKGSDPKEYDHQYLAGKCLKCGLCLEICPNYKGSRRFYGAAFANDCYLIETRSDVHKKDIKKSYDDHFAAGCSKSLACVDVCPMKIPTLASMAKMNRIK